MEAILFYSYVDITETLAKSFKLRYPQGQHVRLVGLLYAQPDSKLTKEEIFPHLDYFNHRSGDNIDFFCVGYDEIFDDTPNKAGEGLTGTWHFNPARFAESVARLEHETNWTYSGLTDLILLNAVFEPSTSTVSIDFTSAIVCRLEEMIKLGAISSTQNFFEQIVRFTQRHIDDDPAWGFSDSSGFRSGWLGIKKVVLSLLPKGIGSELEKTAVFAIKDISKPALADQQGSRMVKLLFARRGPGPGGVHGSFLTNIPNRDLRGGTQNHEAVLSVSQLTHLVIAWITEGKCTFASVILRNRDRVLKISTDDGRLEYQSVQNRIVELSGEEFLVTLKIDTEKENKPKRQHRRRT